MYYYYNFLVRPWVLFKLFWNNLKNFPQFSKIELYTFNKKIKIGLDQDVFKSLAFLEVLTQQTSGNFFFSFIDKRRRISCNRSIVTLRNQYLYDFLIYFFCFLAHLMKRTNDLTPLSLNKQNAYRFFIQDFSVFPFLPLPYYYWKKMFVVEFVFSNNFVFHVKLLLSCFSFSLV